MSVSSTLALRPRRYITSIRDDRGHHAALPLLDQAILRLRTCSKKSVHRARSTSSRCRDRHRLCARAHARARTETRGHSPVAHTSSSAPTLQQRHSITLLQGGRSLFVTRLIFIRGQPRKNPTSRPDHIACLVRDGCKLYDVTPSLR